MQEMTGGRSGPFSGCSAEIGAALRLAEGENLNQKSTCRRLDRAPPPGREMERLVARLYDQVHQNWINRVPFDRRPSPKNWRLVPQTELQEGNKSPEVLLERAIGKLSHQGLLKEWVNQVPVASGLISSNSSRRAAIDLVHWRGNTATFYELKWNSNTPLFAAFEILQYGLAFLCFHANQQELGPLESKLFSAQQIHLKVLAPASYYAGYQHTWLTQALCSGLKGLVAEKVAGPLEMDFEFLGLPPTFQLPFQTGKDVNELLSGPPAAYGPLISALGAIEPVWASEA